jgi:ATP synthase F1 gamma subunit
MKRSRLIGTQLQEIGMIQDLTSALEGVASIQLAKIRDRVLQGRECFDELWQTYIELRLDKKDKRFVEPDTSSSPKKTAINVIITSDSNLGGEIDRRVVDFFVKQPTRPPETIVIGAHGAQLLANNGIRVAQAFDSPELLSSEEIRPIINLLSGYDHISVFYESYLTLTSQEVRNIDLVSVVSALGSDNTSENVISSKDYIFEPSIYEIVARMELTMLEIGLAQLILDSRLAQFASRFNAMLVAEDRAKEKHQQLFVSWRKATRDESDKQQKEAEQGVLQW